MNPDLPLTAAPLRLIDLAPTDVFLGMILAFALCLVLARVAVHTSAGGAQQRTLPRTMVLLGVTVSLIMAVIGNSLARAFGAIGALSLIRFRTAVKDSRDLAWLFMSISIGMTAGSGYFKVAVGATGLMSIFAVLLARLPLANPAVRHCLLRLRHPAELDWSAAILPVLQKHTYEVSILGQETFEGGKVFETVVEVTIADETRTDALLSSLSQAVPALKVSLLMS